MQSPNGVSKLNSSELKPYFRLLLIWLYRQGKGPVGIIMRTLGRRHDGRHRALLRLALKL